MKNKFLKNKKGFSIIEIMVAFSILVIAFIALLSSFPFSLSVNKAAGSATLSSFLSQEKIEELNSSGYENIGVGTMETKHRLSEDPANYLYNFQRQTTVNYVDGEFAESGTDQGMKKISITVYYVNSFSKKEDVYNITTLISQL
jgi:Tfp pilus assembly protein PilV